jgi:rhamnosyltransferase
VAGAAVSVAMATFNGGNFLEMQLASIAEQSRLPDELVVCDDGSADGTPEVVERFATRAPFEVRLIRNEERLGYGANFMKAARLCRGQVIAWSDQDDVWAPDKVARCAPEFERDDDVLLVVHARQIGEWVAPGWFRRGRSVIRGARRREVHTPTSLPFWISAPGYACVVSRRLLEIAEVLGTTHPGVLERFSGHDTFTSFLAGASGKVVLIPDVLVTYRQHTAQVAGAPPPQTQMAMAMKSAGRTQSEFEEGLDREVTRSLFRADLLRDLAAQIDASRPGSGSGALYRSDMWRRHAECQRRRLDLWRHHPRSSGALACLLRDAARGDYGRRDRGGLGIKSLARDLWRVAAITGR